MNPANEFPLLDEAVCSACAECVAVCPAACLEMNGFVPWLPRPKDCISCALCALLCPTGAIRMSLEEKT
jgi:NAD-dependent dihydropyrimidine dehydrogenase PreA subunit